MHFIVPSPVDTQKHRRLVGHCPDAKVHKEAIMLFLSSLLARPLWSTMLSVRHGVQGEAGGPVVPTVSLKAGTPLPPKNYT